MNKKDKRIFLIVGILLILFWLGAILFGNIETDVSGVGEDIPKIWPEFLGGVNIITVGMTWGVMAILIVLAVITRYNLREIPGRFQVMMEMLVGMFDQLCEDTLGKERGRKFMPFVATIFIFVLLSNWVAVIPIGWMEEPTRDLNTCVGLAIICFFVAHIAGIKYKGWKKYLREYIEPVGFLSPFLLILNVVGEIGKTVSHSFRLFGNVMGGAVLIFVLGQLTKQLVLFNTFLNLWFGLFIGLIQAFVFAMLALSYLSVKVNE